MKVRKRPVEVEAFQWTGNEKQTEDPEWIQEALKKGHAVVMRGYEGNEPPLLLIRTPEGVMQAKPGAYIILGTAGEIYPVKEEIFPQIYEIIEE